MYVSVSKYGVPTDRTTEYTTQNRAPSQLSDGAQIPPESGTPASESPGTAPRTWPAYCQSARSRERWIGMVGNHSKELVAT